MGAPGAHNKHPPLSAHLPSCMCMLQSVRGRVKLQNQQAPPTFANPDLEGKLEEISVLSGKGGQETGADEAQPLPRRQRGGEEAEVRVRG